MDRQWAINGRFLTQSVTGVQRYAREIVRALDLLVGRHHPLADGLRLEMLIPPDAKDIPTLNAIRVRPVGRFGGHLWEQAVLPVHARTGLVSLCNTGPVAARKHIVCIHDLNTRSCSGSYSLRFRTLYGVLLPVLGRTTMSVATVSRYSAHELVHYRICHRDKIVIVPDGHEHALRWTPTHSSRTRAVAGPKTIVIIGSMAPHKNIGLLVGMSERLREADLRLAVVGLDNSRVFGAAEIDRSAENISWLGRLPDGELAALLQDSLCLAFPSLVEGFGLPALEAMTCGCPVVASDKASLPEICGDAALYASPTNANAWFSNFMKLSSDQNLRADLIRKGRAQATMFSWHDSAQRYLHAMARADGMAIPRLATTA
jgi:glycosyltransferase involved in cell wall biosynthesis